MSLPSPSPSRAQGIALIEFLVGLAFRMADFAEGYLRLVGIASNPANGEVVSIPTQFALELGAIFQLARWESAGLRPMLTADLPEAEQVYVDLLQRITGSPDEYLIGRTGSELCGRVAFAWLTHCAPAAPEEIGVDFALVGGVADTLLEAVVDFIWQNRQLSRT